MQENQEVSQRLEPGVRYTATLSLTVTGGEEGVTIELTKTPKEYLEGDPSDVIEMPVSYLIMDDILRGILEESEPVTKKPHLTLVH